MYLLFQSYSLESLNNGFISFTFTHYLIIKTSEIGNHFRILISFTKNNKLKYLCFLTLAFEFENSL